MAAVIQPHPYTIGVDTRARNHVYAIISTATREPIKTRTFPTTSTGISRALDWLSRRADADLDTLWVIEGAASYGAILEGAVGAAGYQVAEAPRMDDRARRGLSKSDPVDAHRIAEAVLFGWGVVLNVVGFGRFLRLFHRLDHGRCGRFACARHRGVPAVADEFFDYNGVLYIGVPRHRTLPGTRQGRPCGCRKQRRSEAGSHGDPFGTSSCR